MSYRAILPIVSNNNDNNESMQYKRILLTRNPWNPATPSTVPVNDQKMSELQNSYTSDKSSAKRSDQLPRMMRRRPATPAPTTHSRNRRRRCFSPVVIMVGDAYSRS
jgi:hypothetical protein